MNSVSNNQVQKLLFDEMYEEITIENTLILNMEIYLVLSARPRLFLQIHE